jgi:hypothetical protein
MNNRSTYRQLLVTITLLTTTLIGIESLQAAPLPLDLAVVSPGQTNIISNNVAVNKKRRNKKKRTSSMKKTGDAMQRSDAMKKPEGDAMKK